MSQAAERTGPRQPPGAGDARRRRRPVRRGAGLLVVIGALGVPTQACSPEVGIERDDGPRIVQQDDGGAAGASPSGPTPTQGTGGERAAGQSAGWDEVRDDLGVSPADFRRRWNDAVAALDAGEPLGEPTEAASAFRGLPTRHYPVDNLTTAEIVLTPEQDRVVSVRAANIFPVGAQQRRDLLATVRAAVSAVTGLSPAEARQRVAADLDVTEDTVGDQHHDATAEIEGVTVGVFAAHGTWELFLQRRSG